MRTLFGSLIIAASVFMTPAAASANDQLCNIYGHVGQSVANYILPMTMQELVEMLTGQNPEAMGGFARSMSSGLSDEQLGILATVNPQDIELLSTLSGQTAMQMLMSGQVADTSRLGAILEQQCNQAGGGAVMIERMRRANQAFAGQ